MWAQKTNQDRPWAGLHVLVPAKAKALFDVAVDAVFGNGEEILFWKDRWLDGHTLAELAPNLVKTVPKRIANRRTVVQALTVQVHDIKGALTVQVLVEYLQIWEMADVVVLRQNVADQYKWELMQHGSYSSKSAYEAFFLGSIRFGPWRKIWKTWAPACCKFFIWLVFHGRVWTANRLAKRNLTHPEACPLCDQAAADPEIDKKGLNYVLERLNMIPQCELREPL